MKRAGTLGVAAIAAAVIATALIAALAAQGQDQPQPTFRTEANYVRVDVFPTRDGVAVPDLGKDDFEILDEGVPQTIDQFERVLIPGNVPQAARREPSTAAESRQMLEDARARVLAVFFDTPHVDLNSSRRIGQPLVDLLERHLGADDMVGLMTPDMRATDVTFARRTTAVERVLARDWWGDRDRLDTGDPVEEKIKACYPPGAPGTTGAAGQELIDRYREQKTLAALEDLVQFVGGVRDERKAILVITSGWRLFGPTSAISGPDNPPPPPPIGTDPLTGRLATRPPYSVTAQDCESTRMALTSIDSPEQFRRLLAEANRANASFYPVDPQGLAAFDSPLGPNPPPPPAVDAARLRERNFNLRTLANDTDGLAVVGTNNLSAGFDRIVADLSSYYLIGYYATNVKMDGRFHKITVRVKRPGVSVRARSGYLAPSPEEVAAALRAAAAPAAPEPDAAAAAVDDALGVLARADVDEPLRVHAATAPGGGAAWIVGEVGSNTAWSGGAQLDAIVTTADGDTVGAVRGRIEPGARAIVLPFQPSEAMAPGEYRVSIRARALAGGDTAGGDARMDVAAGRASGAIVFRRGPSTGNRDAATADFRFRRNERIRVEVPGMGASTPDARLLDRHGAPLPVPVTPGAREADGTAWGTAEVALAPLAPGDYLIEMGSGSGRVLTAFRLVR